MLTGLISSTRSLNLILNRMEVRWGVSRLTEDMTQQNCSGSDKSSYSADRSAMFFITSAGGETKGKGQQRSATAAIAIHLWRLPHVTKDNKSLISLEIYEFELLLVSSIVLLFKNLALQK